MSAIQPHEQSKTETGPEIAVLATHVLLTVTIEGDPGGEDEIHLHPGGQGYWVARMIRSLGAEAQLLAPMGGETGAVVEGLLRRADLDLRPVRVSSCTPAYIHDRRSGERQQVAVARSRALGRHEEDDLFEAFLAGAVDAGIAVVTGRADEGCPDEEFYRRLGVDLHAAGVRVVGDLHGRELRAFLSGGPMEVLKVSDEDLEFDGVDLTGSTAMDERIHLLRDLGAGAVVVSRSGRPSRAYWHGRTYEVDTPQFDAAESRGAGDSMTAALAVALARGLEPEHALALAAGAGAASVTRHGLASADAALVAAMARRVEVRPLSPGLEPTAP